MNRTMVVLVLFWAALPAGAQRARVDFDHNCHFSHYKTFSWLQPSHMQQMDAAFPNQLMQQRIVAFIDQALAAKGFRPVRSGGDLLLSYDVNVTELPIYTTIDNGWGWGWGNGWGNGISTTTTQMIYRGTLVVDIREAHQGQLVFQGVSTLTISSRPTRNTKKLGKAVDEIFEKYPPRT